MKVTIIGSGYVGLVAGACLADVGNDVLCLDVDPVKISLLQAGGICIYEPGLEEMVRKNVDAGRLSFTTDVRRSVEFGQLQFIAVGTPPDEDGSADLQYVLNAARNIGRYMQDYKVVIDKSTVPVGTSARVKAAVADELALRGVTTEYSVVSNPEFLKEGVAIDDFMRPDRVVIGSDDDKAIQIMRELYAPFQRQHDRVLIMDASSAELTKYAANAMLATRISFMNELAMLSEKLGADIESVRRGIGSDSRIGWHFLYPGCGYGGSCFPKDVRALLGSARETGESLRVLRAVEEANERQKSVLVDKIVARFGADLSGRRFALWGLSFKPETDDMREAPSCAMIRMLLDHGASLVAYDPAAVESARRLFGGEARLEFAEHPMAALRDADALVIITEWKEFRSPDFEAIKSKLRMPIIFDGRNMFDPTSQALNGIEYFGIGRKSCTKTYIARTAAC